MPGIFHFSGWKPTGCVSRSIYVTDALGAHEVGFLADGSISFANSCYNCPSDAVA